MPSLDIEILLEDSRLVIDYATKAGMLTDDSLPSAFDGVQKALAANQVPKLAPLRTALNNTINTIAPHISLLDLRAGKSPFAPSNKIWTKRLHITLSIVSVILAILVAESMLDLNEETALLKTLQQIQEARPYEKLGTLLKLARDGALDSSKSNTYYKSGTYYEYQRLFRELEDLFAKMHDAGLKVQLVAGNSPWPFVDLMAPAVRFIKQKFSREPEYPAGTGYVASGAPSSVASDKIPRTPFDLCDVKVVIGPDNYIGSAQRERSQAFCFAEALGLRTAAYTYGTISALQAHIYLKNTWILPCLAGLLGASVFLMRFFQINSRAPVMEWHGVLLRLALGAIAGVIIGWFWIPSNQMAEISTFTSAPFGLAFLAGFSIDILFSLLDRLSRSISEPTSTKPPEEKGK